MEDRRYPVHVEVALRPGARASASPAVIRLHVKEYLKEYEAVFRVGPLTCSSSSPLASYIEEMLVTQCGTSKNARETVSYWQADLNVHVFELSDLEPELDVIAIGGGDEGEISPCNQWVLPRRDFSGLWDSLVLETNIKDRLVDYAMSALRFSAAGVRDDIIRTNKMVLLHGPPGTGKTTLCRALAQRLAVRMSYLYENAVLVEIHTHSLFSKWFSESGKLVARLFEHIEELVEESDTLVVVLIDEVESLTSARTSALNGTEPGDAVRVVNAMLTQLDRLRRHKNVLTLCTTNLVTAIDSAFIDRADIKAFVGLPPASARYKIFCSCMEELQRVGLVTATSDSMVEDAEENDGHDRPIGSARPVTINTSTTNQMSCYSGSNASNLQGVEMKEGTPTKSVAPAPFRDVLFEAASAAEDLSGRTLRKLPFLAHATYIQAEKCSDLEFAKALLAAVHDEQRERECLDSKSC